MPQAMPMYWLNLYLILTLIFLMIMIKMYFNYTKMPSYYNFKHMKKTHWKW
uniref:ATP synthase F0 subunit 8 n=1 Tax=Halyziini sp. HA TaxID=2511224 RepID=A0A411DAJ6_9CUCU|nr:ATP synthase F0 subunit 8 [Halyziini sp. HA]